MNSEKDGVTKTIFEFLQPPQPSRATRQFKKTPSGLKWLLALSIDEELEWALARVNVDDNATPGLRSTYSRSGATIFGGAIMPLPGLDIDSTEIDLQDTIYDAITSLIHQRKDVADIIQDIDAIGISSVGVIERDKVRLKSIRRKPWRQRGPVGDQYRVDFTELFEKIIPNRALPISLHNDVTAMCLAEHRWQDPNNRVGRLCYVNISQGINVGIVDEYRPLAHGHPELGHAYPPISVNEEPTFNPAHSGCLAHKWCYEGIASRARILKQWHQELETLPHKTQKLIAHYVAHLCWTVMLASVPDRIVLGGLVVFPEFVDMVRDEFDTLNAGYNPVDDDFDHRYIQQYSRKKLDDLIEIARLGKNAGILGALELARNALLV